jgi:photosystem II stability/assembly factor-like uncharacterized protein
VACSSTTDCVAGGSTSSTSGCSSGAMYVTSDGGHHWTSSPQQCFVPTSVACPSSQRCEVVGFTSDGSHEYGEILTSHDGGTHWQLQMKLPDQGSAMTGISCETVSTCEAVGSSPSQPILGTLNGGTAWISQHLPSDAGPVHLTAVGCGSLLVCQAVGDGAQFSTQDGGQKWVRQAAPSTLDSLKGLSCPTADLCTAVATSSNGGGSATLKLPL